MNTERIDLSSERSILGIRFDPKTIQEAVDWIIDRTSRGHTRIVFVNTEAAIRAQTDPGFAQSLQSADLRLADGVGLQLGDVILNGKTHDNVNGTDLFPLLCLSLSTTNQRLYLFGGHAGVAQRAALKIRSLYPNIQIVGVSSGYFTASQEADIIAKIKSTKPHILLVGLGAPEQELWLEKNLVKTGARVGLGVGGLFDYYAGRTTRAPHIVRRYGLEWLWRLYQEPSRFWRQLAIPKFLWLVVVAKGKQMVGVR